MRIRIFYKLELKPINGYYQDNYGYYWVCSINDNDNMFYSLYNSENIDIYKQYRGIQVYDEHLRTCKDNVKIIA